ncbi:MAG TPA: hypothetical protein VJM12_04740 [Pyrinomonadaceae bacterium]|nr:hypothetical protein [Pyrinomonadaceae bacterium]
MPKRLRYDPNLALPAPPRFDDAATAAARPVEPLPQRRFMWVYENIQLAPSHWKLLVVTAVVSLTTGGVGGMLIKDGQQSLANEPTLNSISGESQPFSSPENVPSAGGMIEASAAEVEPSPAVQPRRHTRLRRAPRVQVVELADEDSEDEDKDDRRRKKDDDDDDDRDRKNETRRRRAMLYDVMRIRRP